MYGTNSNVWTVFLRLTDPTMYNIVDIVDYVEFGTTRIGRAGGNSKEIKIDPKEK